MTDLFAELVWELFDYDPQTGELLRRNASGSLTPVGNNVKWKYKNVSILGKRYLVHRVIWLMWYGTWPTEQIDHINGNGKDNRIENLREATSQQNSSNKIGGNNTTGIKGVYLNGGRLYAAIGVATKVIHLGSFSTKAEAALAYAEAAKRYHGEFANLVSAENANSDPTIYNTRKRSPKPQRAATEANPSNEAFITWKHGRWQVDMPNGARRGRFADLAEAVAERDRALGEESSEI